jgi:hypothetical protein
MNPRLRFDARSIRARLTLVIMSTVTAASLAGFVSLLVYDIVDSRRALVLEAETLCSIVADRTAYALAFGDAEAARSNLAALASHPSVSAAVILDQSGAGQPPVGFRSGHPGPVRPGLRKLLASKPPGNFPAAQRVAGAVRLSR